MQDTSITSRKQRGRPGDIHAVGLLLNGRAASGEKFLRRSRTRLGSLKVYCEDGGAESAGDFAFA